METAQEMTRASQNQRVVIFDLPHPLPPGQETIPQPQARKAGLVPEVTRGGW